MSAEDTRANVQMVFVSVPLLDALDAALAAADALADVVRQHTSDGRIEPVLSSYLAARAKVTS